MTITAYPLRADPVPLQLDDEGPVPCWHLRCPVGFEATWSGGPGREDITVRILGNGATSDESPPFVQSRGGGRLTLHSGYQMQTPAGRSLWARGPIEHRKLGLAPIEQIARSSIFPTALSIDWHFLQPGTTVRFEAGEPFATLLLTPSSAPALKVETPTSDHQDPATHTKRFLASLAGPELESIVAELAGTERQQTARAELVALNRAWAEGLVDPPAVSCICPTHGRIERLEEAVYSFLQQDYPGPKELLILNDHPEQTLEFDHPEVRVVNRRERYASAGDKCSDAVALASHDLLVAWHADHIDLPHRLSWTVSRFDPSKGLLRPERGWLLEGGAAQSSTDRYLHSACCWTRRAFEQAGGFPSTTRGYMQVFERRCSEQRGGSLQVVDVEPTQVFHIRRVNRSETAATRVGQIQLEPRWKHDYPALVTEALLASPSLDADTRRAREDAVYDVPFPPPYRVIPPPPALPSDEATNLFRGTHPVPISVILPAANESVMLERTVRGLLATLPPGGEVIVVDNGSTDGSADFIDTQRPEGVHLIRSPHLLGVSGARNRGLQQARGEVIVFADAHVDVPERWWEPMVAALNRPNVGVVGPAIGAMGVQTAPISYGQEILEPNLRGRWLPRRGETAYPVPSLGGGFMAMRRETLDDAGAFDEGMPEWGSEDLELCIRYWRLGYQVLVVPEVLILHYFRKVRPYAIANEVVTRNLLRVALLHFDQGDLAKILSVLKQRPDFAHGLAAAMDSDVWSRRSELLCRSKRDMSWLRARFGPGPKPNPKPPRVTVSNEVA